MIIIAYDLCICNAFRMDTSTLILWNNILLFHSSGAVSFLIFHYIQSRSTYLCKFFFEFRPVFCGPFFKHIRSHIFLCTVFNVTLSLYLITIKYATQSTLVCCNLVTVNLAISIISQSLISFNKLLLIGH